MEELVERAFWYLLVGQLLTIGVFMLGDAYSNRQLTPDFEL